jgi:hypothetical protein
MAIFDLQFFVFASILFVRFIDCSEIYRSLSLSVHKSKGPVFNFGNEMQKLLYVESEDILDLEVLYYEYLNVLRDYYVEDFSERIRTAGSGNNKAEQKHLVLRECKSAMKAATPTSEKISWSYEVMLIIIMELWICSTKYLLFY